MGFDAGCNFAVGGSWEKPSEAFPQGRLIAANGLVTAKKIGDHVRITLTIACAPENIAWSITPRADFPETATSWCVSPVDNANYDVKFDSGDGLVERSFDFIAVKFGQPQQGTGK